MSLRWESDAILRWLWCYSSYTYLKSHSHCHRRHEPRGPPRYGAPTLSDSIAKPRGGPHTTGACSISSAGSIRSHNRAGKYMKGKNNRCQNEVVKSECISESGQSGQVSGAANQLYFAIIMTERPSCIQAGESACHVANEESCPCSQGCQPHASTTMHQ